jgi:DNA polymerase delta subunit 3
MNFIMQTTVLQPIIIFLAHLFRLPINDSSSFYVLAANAEAQICAREALDGGSSDDDGEKINFKRASNGEGSRKRRVVFDLSDEDEYEDAVNLASPDIPKGQSSLDQKQSTKILVSEKSKLNSEKEIENKSKVKEEMVTDKESNLPLREDSSVISKGANAGTSSPEKAQICIPESDLNKEDKATLAAPNSPKKRKVLKTRIDERGREGTHV